MSKHIFGVGGVVGFFALLLLFKLGGSEKVEAVDSKHVPDDVDIAERVRNEIKERNRKAGIASGEARRKKKEEKEAASGE